MRSLIPLVVYRGLWCPFCQAYVKKLASLRHSIVAAGGETLIVSSSAPAHIPEFRNTTGYDGPAVTEVDSNLVNNLLERSMVDVAITQKSEYPNGMIQPAILVVKRGGVVVEKWAIDPSLVSPVRLKGSEYH